VNCEDGRNERVDVIVVGGGNAGFCAAHAAAERGRNVLLLEKAPLGEDGGNSYYTAGAFRVAHDGMATLADIVEPDPRHERTVLPPYPAEAFTADMRRVTNDRCDPQLTARLVRESTPTMGWLAGLGLRFRLMYERQSYQDESGKFVFWGGLAVGSVDGGQGLIEQHTAVAHRLGIQTRYGQQVTDLVTEDGAVVGVRVRPTGRPDAQAVTINAESVVLAAGGFEASAESRKRYLGDGWERAKVRGNPLNTGEILEAALSSGAQRAGDWGSCHSVAWDAAASETGDRHLTNRLTRQSYPLGIVVNSAGRRFVDEGADFRNYTYAKYGAEILRQPGGVAFQLFDATTRPLLRSEEYDSPGASEVIAESITELGERLGINAGELERTVKEFNEAIDESVPFQPAVKDGRAATGIEPPKSNWAQPLRTAPFYAYPVTCGITFTFGGLRADVDARVLDAEGSPIEGLFACGELIGGLFSGNYPGGAGLTSGAVFGRRAGTAA
jgi:tricarballylate dehydrogenase